MTMLRSIAAPLIARLRRPRALPSRPFPQGGFVAFVVPIDAATRVKRSDDYFTIVASMRLRALIPARHLAERVPVWLVPLEDFLRDPSLSRLGTAGAVVIGKLPAPSILQRREVFTQLLARLAAGRGGVPFFADMPDDLAALGKAMHEPYLARYQKALGASCPFIVPCRALGEGLARDARRGAVVIEDPYENRARPVRVAPSPSPRLLWFGNLGSVNAAQLEGALARVAGSLRDLPIRIDMVTRAEARPLLDALGARLRAVHPGCDLQFSAWSLDATEQALERCDFVLLPQDYRHEWARGKSHNRLVTAIRGGRFALASPIPAYRELGDYAWVGDDLAAGIRWAFAHPDEASARVRAGQQYIETRFSPEVIAGKWARALGLP